MIKKSESADLINEVRTHLRIIILAVQKRETDYGLEPSISEGIIILNEKIEKLIEINVN